MSSIQRSYSTPISNMLVPLDGSAYAEQALPVALRLAKRTGAKLHFATVEPPLSVVGMSPDLPAPSALTLQALRDRLRGYLASEAGSVQMTHGIRTATSVLRGTPAAALAAYAAAHEVDLVVLTTHGRGGISRFWLGSVAEQLLRKTAAPVLVLRPDAAAFPEFYRVLIALDGTAQSEGAIGPGIRLARTTAGSRVILAQVVEPPPPIYGLDHDEETREAGERLEHLAQRLRLQGITATAQVATGAGIAKQILGIAKAENADLIVVGTHGAKGVERLLLGSVADKVVRGAIHAVLVVPCKPRPVVRRPTREGAGAATERPVL